MTREQELFQEAVRLVAQGFYVDSIDRFRQLIAQHPGGDLADDASYNIGLSYFKLNQFDPAVAEFRRTIADYPEATIDPGEFQNEKGKTAAKAHLGCISCLLAMGKLDEAKETLAKLKDYAESGVVGREGSFKSFHALGEELIAKFEDQQILEISEQSSDE
jgi:TolA-binding protein